MAGAAAVSVLTGSIFAVAALVVIISTFLPSASPDRSVGIVRVVNTAALVAAVLMYRLRYRAARWLPHLAVFGGVLLITTALSASGGGSSAVAYACVYCIAPAYGFFILTRRAASLHLVLTIVVGAPTLAVQPGVGAAEQVVVWGITVLLAGAIGWLVHALEQAEGDSLTGLANRRGLERALQQAIASAGDRDAVALAFLDLDHFKAYNEDQGRAGGDWLLAQTALLWAPLVPEGATLARHGPDEFAVVLTGPDAATATALVTRLRSAVPAGVTVSAGVADWEQGESASMLVGRTDAAVYAAKRDGRARTHRHPGVGEEGREIRTALARGEFRLEYQPIVDLGDGSTVGAEALVRWDHPERGLVPPLDFLPEAERTGVVVELGRWVLREACRQAARWWSGPDGNAPLYLSVNASGRELQDPRYADTVEGALRDSGLPAHRLMLELVESDYDIESLHLASNLHRLRTLGVMTAIDDFGVGHSSLDRLRRARVDVLKIDRSFVADITDTDAGAPLVSAILAMAHALGARVIAEGAETVEQAQWLADHGCDAVQGWLFGRPGPGRDLEQGPRSEHTAAPGRRTAPIDSPST